MRVGVVTSRVKAVGGVEVFNKDITRLLEGRGHEVEIFGAESLGEISGENLEESVGNYFNLANKRNPYDVVLCNGEFGYSVEHPKAINVFHGNYHGYAIALRDLVNPEITKERFRKAEMQKVSAKDKYVVVVSNLCKNQLEESGVDVDQAINNSANTDIFYPRGLETEVHNLSASRGRYYEKGLDVLDRLASKGMKIRLFSDTKISKENIENRDFVTPEELAIEYNSANLFLSPSRFEGGGLTILEAMASGCPVITTPTGYGVDIQDEIKNFVAKDFDEFFVKSYLVSNERAKYSQLALDYFQEFHSPEKFRKDWVELIEGA